jgi:hypothetical protein
MRFDGGQDAGLDQLVVQVIDQGRTASRLADMFLMMSAQPLG